MQHVLFANDAANGENEGNGAERLYKPWTTLVKEQTNHVAGSKQNRCQPYPRWIRQV
jgi:hypothetical protein